MLWIRREAWNVIGVDDPQDDPHEYKEKEEEGEEEEEAVPA
jgi:hypothetical protein